MTILRKKTLKNIFEMQEDQIGYDEIIENAMRSVIYQTLKKIDKKGLPGKHYFIITFMTKFPGVSISKALQEKYFEEMTIAIQYQYKDLVVEDDFFKISLSFAGKYEKLTIPYKAVTSFADPSMNFALKFSMNYNELDEVGLEEGLESNKINKNSANDKSEDVVDLSAKVVSLDAFRKNRNKDNPENS